MSLKLKILIIVIDVIVNIFIIIFIRKKRIKEQYSVLWMLIGFLLIIVTVFSNIIDKIAEGLGVYYEPSLIFLISILGVLAILFQYSIVISKLTEKTTILAQELAILKYKLEKLQEK